MNTFKDQFWGDFILKFKILPTMILIFNSNNLLDFKLKDLMYERIYKGGGVGIGEGIL